MANPRIGGRVRVISTGQEGTLKMRLFLKNGRQAVQVLYDKPDTKGFQGVQTWVEDIEAVPKKAKGA